MPDADDFISAAEAQAPLYVGVDVGGTNIKIGLVDDEGRCLAYDKVPTGVDAPAEDAAARMGEGVRRIVEEAGVGPEMVARVGLATPGPIDLKTGYLIGPGNLPNWWNFPIRDRVSHHSGYPVTFANDANAAAYGEYWQGAGREYGSMILLTLGTGVGGGIILGDLIIDGQHGCGSECGHVLIDPRPDARRDSLNKTGSLEAYCGAYSVVARAEEAVNAEPDSALARRRAAAGEITPLMIAEEAKAGDAVARRIVLETARYLALGIVSMVHMIDPDGVVLGGAMTFGGPGHPLGEEFLQTVRDEAIPRLLEPLRDKVVIEFATLGGDAGFIGAAGLARIDDRKAEN